MYEVQTLFPTARGSLRLFFPPQKGKPRTSQNPLSENPLSAMHENFSYKNRRLSEMRKWIC